MKMVGALAVASLALSANALVTYRGQGFLSAGMQPDMAAKTLARVAEEWKAQAHAFTECKAGVDTDVMTDCSQASKAFRESCAKVTDSIVEASLGNAGNVVEYMNDVCSERSLSGWHRVTCISFGRAVSSQMSASSYDNREKFNAGKSCDSIWSELAGEQEAEEKRLELEEKKDKEAEVAEQKKAATKAQEEKKEKVAEKAKKAAAVAVAEKKKAEASKAHAAKAIAEKKNAEALKAEAAALAKKDVEDAMNEALKDEAAKDDDDKDDDDKDDDDKDDDDKDAKALKKEADAKAMAEQQKQAKILNKAIKGLR